MATDGDRKSPDPFTEQERITANLRFRSLPAAQRTMLGVFALLPPKWRGPLAIILVVVVGFLLARGVPSLVEWLRSK